MPSTQKDHSLNKIPNLSWLPWVGSEVFDNGQRLLIVGESHYANGETNEAYEDNLSRLGKNDFTRNLIKETQLQKRYQHKALGNFFKAFFGNASVNNDKLWKEIAFYNFVQRTMNYSSFDSKKTEQPTINDFDRGWEVFVELAKILKPTDCIFIGVAAATSFERMMDRLKVNRTDRVFHPKIGSTAPVTSSVTIDGCTINMTFVRHSSAYFSSEEWHPFLQKHHGRLIEELSVKAK